MNTFLSTQKEIDHSIALMQLVKTVSILFLVTFQKEGGQNC